MNRKIVIIGVVLFVAVLAGCASPGDVPTTTNEDVPTTTTNENVQTTEEDVSVHIQVNKYEDAPAETEIEPGDGENSVIISGVYKDAPTPCYDPVVQSSTYNEGELVVEVGVEQDGSEACTQVITDIGYKIEATAPGPIESISIGRAD